MTRLRIDDVLPLLAAAARLGMRKARTVMRRAEMTPPLAPGSRIHSGAGDVLVVDRDAAEAMARGLGMTRSQATREWVDGVLYGLTAMPPESVPVALLCRVDLGTASAELQLSPRGAIPDGARIALHVAAVGAYLLARIPELRRVGITIPDGHPTGGGLVSQGFADEGWAPPVRGTGASRMFTLLRA